MIYFELCEVRMTISGKLVAMHTPLPLLDSTSCESLSLGRLLPRCFLYHFTRHRAGDSAGTTH
jgi:hypothetical protein